MSMRLSLTILAAVLCFGSCVLAAPRQPALVYVSTKGDDAWSGKLPAPNNAATDGPFA